MAIQDTKARILDSAVRLFTERGIEAVSLRAVTADAGVNIAAVNYHFGSKGALLQAMTQRFFTTVNAEQLQRLETLEASGRPPTVEGLLVAFASPLFALFDSAQGREWVRAWVMARSGQLTGHADNRMAGEESATVTRRYYEAFRQVLPHLTPDELWWRFERANSLLMANQGKHAMPSPSREERSERMRHDERNWLITFLAGALNAPATGDGPSRSP